MGLTGTCSLIQDISLPIHQMQNIDFEGLFGNIHMVISFSKQLLSTLEASDAIGMNSAVTFSQQAGTGFAGGRVEQFKWWKRITGAGLPHQSSSKAQEICVAPWATMLRNMVALRGLLSRRDPHSSLLHCQLLLLRPWASCVTPVTGVPTAYPWESLSTELPVLVGDEGESWLL